MDKAPSCSPRLRPSQSKMMVGEDVSDASAMSRVVESLQSRAGADVIFVELVEGGTEGRNGPCVLVYEAPYISGVQYLPEGREEQSSVLGAPR